MALSVNKTQRRTPGTSKQQPTIDSKSMADIFQIPDQIGRGIAGEFAMGKRAPGTSLIDEYDPIPFGIEKGTMIRLATGTRSAVQEHDG